ncbi:MAG: DUF177 domain-containing protein [Egibacteraceae bacterium]
MAPDTVLPIADVVGRPGASRRVDLVLPVPEGLDLLIARATEPTRLTGEVCSVVGGGVLVRGMLSANLWLQCARCLEDVAVQFVTDVAELFSDPLQVDGLEAEARGTQPRKLGPLLEDVIEEGYQITDDAIDLDALVRDALVPLVPCQPLCDSACKGLCPACGVNRNEVECACRETTTDPRWAVLENLRLKADGA